MKQILILTLLLTAISCKNAPATGTYGTAFDNANAQDFKTALSAYNSGKDTSYIIQGTIDNVCSHSGCWISFKNDTTDFYVNTNEKFTMPKDSKGKKATAKGKFVKDEDGVVSFEPTGVIIE